jgi:hypothetical protein
VNCFIIFGSKRISGEKRKLVFTPLSKIVLNLLYFSVVLLASIVKPTFSIFELIACTENNPYLNW